MAGENIPDQDKNRSSFRFRFWKDRVWVWTFLLPLGVICWGMPVVVLLGLKSSEMPIVARIMVLVFLGIPAYLVGYIFVYNFIEGIFTKVTITDQKISHQAPWVIFPLILVTKNIAIPSIHHIDLMVGYGIGRFAVQVGYQRGEKKRYAFIPQFKDSEYIRTVVALKNWLEVSPVPAAPSASGESRETFLSHKKEEALKPNRYISSRPLLIERFLTVIINLSIFAMFGICGWITTNLPAPKVEAFMAGFGVAIVCIWIAFCGVWPGIGQVALWLLGRPVIRAVLWLFQLPKFELGNTP